MQISRVRRAWAEGRPAGCTLVHLTDPSVCEMASLMGFDCLWIDLEHHSTSVQAASQMFRAARVGGSDVLARPGKGEFMRMARLLEAGAHGILYPRCDDAQEARQVVRWCKFHPLGERGFDGGNPDMPFCSMEMEQYVKVANEQTFIAIQIECPAAVQHAQAIAEVEGVDLLFFGPADFSVLSGIPGQFSAPTILAAQQQVCNAALAAGKRFAAVASNADHARHLLDMGATFLTHGCDLTYLKAGWEQQQEQFAALGFRFPNRLAASCAYR